MINAVRHGNQRYSLLFDLKWLPHCIHFLQQDLARQYDRTSLGIIWLLIGQTINISGIAFVFSMVFNTALKDFFPYLAISILSWSLISGVISDAPRLYHAAGPVLNAFPIPYGTFALRMVLRHFVVLAYGLPVYAAVALYFFVPAFPTVLLAVPNLILLFLLLYPLANILGILGARFRDIAPTVSSLIYLLFLVSPVIYDSARLPPNSKWLVYCNPLYYLLELVRRPFLGQVPGLEIYLVVLAMAVVAWILSTMFDRKFGRYIVFWV